jgi:RNA polymerase sigma-70 factor (ECF subfamily)
VQGTRKGYEQREDPWAEHILRAARGDSQALAALYDGTSSLLYGLAVRMVTDQADAEEVILDVFSHVWRSGASYDSSRGSGMAWLVMLTRSRCLDRIRSRDARKRAEDPIRHESPLVFSPDPVARDEALRVQKALAELPEEQRQLIELAYFSGLSQTDLADRFAIPLGTVKTRMRLGMSKLRNLLSGSRT